jgi:uncharacterized membrane protein YfbV (UPF0208 family)
MLLVVQQPTEIQQQLVVKTKVMGKAILQEIRQHLVIINQQPQTKEVAQMLADLEQQVDKTEQQLELKIIQLQETVNRLNRL